MCCGPTWAACLKLPSVNNLSNIRLSIGKATVFKLFLLCGIVFISVVFIWYTLNVIAQLKDDSERMVTSYVRLWQLAASESSTGGEVQVIFEEVIKKANFPVIIADADGAPVFWRNVPGIVDNDPSDDARASVGKMIVEMRRGGAEVPLTFGDKVISYFYYGDSRVIRQLRWMPFVEIVLVTAFIVVGFIGFQSIKRSEERSIWVGMAKEAAHQLGTPISSLMGWLELLAGDDAEKEAAASDPSLASEEIYTQMKTDITRLQRVANRFGQIGSQPELADSDFNQLVEETATYFRRRLPFNGQGVVISLNTSALPAVSLNGELFTWALENLIKNSLQAVDSQTGKVEITTALGRDNRFVTMELTDNGRGIPPGVARKVFRPGFTTKKRGWGLGLTLSKRIIEEYHRGRLSLVKSRPGETIFQIVLPVKATDRVNRNWYPFRSGRSI